MKQMAARQTLSDVDLARYADEHMYYEIEMFFAAGNLVGSGSVDQRMQNAFVESFILHARNLIMLFFHPRKIRQYDVIADDFFTNPIDWKSVRPRMSPTIQSALDRADKELAHLTTQRISGSPAVKNWDANQVTTALIPVIEKFVDGADPHRLLKSTADKIRNLLKPAPVTMVSTPGILACVPGLTRTSFPIL
ncbi:MAG: hypothetical protein WD688_12455 [Candidatus Binatia bacterium]